MLDVAGYEGHYKISSCGEVYSIKRGFKKMSTPVDSGGYKRLGLSIKGKVTHHLVHRLVAEAFIPNPNNLPQVNHINGVKTDNRVENLEWCTRSYNVKHAFANSLSNAAGSNNPRAKITEDDVRYIRSCEGLTQESIAKQLDISRSLVGQILRKEVWKNV